MIGDGDNMAKLVRVFSSLAVSLSDRTKISSNSSHQAPQQPLKLALKKSPSVAPEDYLVSTPVPLYGVPIYPPDFTSTCAPSRASTYGESVWRLLNVCSKARTSSEPIAVVRQFFSSSQNSVMSYVPLCNSVSAKMLLLALKYSANADGTVYARQKYSTP